MALDDLSQTLYDRLKTERDPNLSTDQGVNSTSPYFLGVAPGSSASRISDLSSNWSATGQMVAAYDQEAQAKIKAQQAQQAAAAAAKKAEALAKKMQQGLIASDAAHQRELQRLQQAAGSSFKVDSTGALPSGSFDSQSASQLRIARSYGYSLGQANYSKAYVYDPSLDKARNKALALATSYLGTRYQLGGESHQSIDCSGLVQAVYQQMGYRVPTHSAADQGQTGGRHNSNGIPGQRVAWGSSALKPGDLIAWKDGSHIAIYAGNGQIIEAANTKVGTVKRALWANPNDVVGIHLAL